MQFKKLGLTLSGGGGKGAYQIGVWQALRDYGLDSQLKAISGSSVGGLNGAMFAQGKFEQARHMWLNIESHNMLSVQDVPFIAQHIASLAGAGMMSPILANFISTKGFFKQEGLKNMIAEGLEAGRLAESALSLTVALHNTNANRVDYLEVRDAHSAANMLLATAALPFIFDEVNIGGTTYTDGGFYWGLPNKNVDNTPIKPLVEAGCDTIIVVHLSPEDLSIDPRHFPGVRILPIVPSQSLGGLSATLDFSNAGAAKRMEQGYADALLLLRHLELFISNEMQYESLWERVRATAEHERALSAKLQATDHAHQRTIGDIHSFNRQIQQDDFRHALHLAADDDEVLPQALDQLALENSALLADIERQRIETAVDSFLAQNHNNRNKVEGAVMDALAALSPVTGRANHLRDQGVFSRLWGSITGENQRIAATNDHDLAQAQFAALRLIAAVQEKGAVTLEFACALQNRLNHAFDEINRLGERHNRDLRRVYRSLAAVYCKLRDRLIQHEDRLTALERQGRLHHWLLHPNSTRLDGKTLKELPIEQRLTCIANDFYRLTEGRWSVSELVSLKEMCISTGLDDQHPIQVAPFFNALANNALCIQTLSERLVVLEDGQQQQPSQPARWLRDLRNKHAEPINREQALSLWGYGEHSQLPAWDFLAELLYHLKAAGFSVLHSSDLGQYKETWLTQLNALDGLVQESILPASFSNEIKELRESISSFHLKVPLIGKFSVGKSTLLNQWLGEDIQKDDLGACTSLATEFHYADRDAEKLVIHWFDDSQSNATRREERPLSAYAAFQADPRLHTEPPLFIELHLNRSALARHPDLILVDTPGFGSGNGTHERALQQYIGEGVACILCVTRTSQVGIDEMDFIQRQRSLGQDFSLLVCQEALNTPSQRDSLRQMLATQAGIDPSSVRGCSAREGDLSGFDDLLARLEQEKAALFHENLAPRVQAVVQQAEQLIRKQLALDTTRNDLLEERSQLDRNRQRLEENYQSERESLLRDCRGTITRQVISTANSYLRSRRSSYAQMLLGGQSIGALLTADARNACQLAIEQCLTPRFKEACQNLGNHIEISTSTGDAAFVGGDGPSAMEQSDGLGGAAAGAAAGAAIGTALPIIGTMIGGLIGGVIGFFTSRNSQESEADSKAMQAVESVTSQLESVIPDVLEKQASQFLSQMHEKISAQLDSQQQNIQRIDEQLSADEQRRQQIKTQAEQALGQVTAMLAQQAELSA